MFTAIRFISLNFLFVFEDLWSYIVDGVLMPYATSMFTRELDNREWSLVFHQCKMDPANTYFHPELCMLARACTIPEIAQSYIYQYKERLMNCRCWYCDSVRPRKPIEQVDMYDVWLKYLLYCNGFTETQMN